MDIPSVSPYRQRDWPTPPEDSLSLAFIGLGEFTTDWVLPSAAAAQSVDIGAVVSGSSEKAARVAAEYDATPLTYAAYADGEAVGSYDAVYIATPNATHLEYVHTAASQRKAVLCEKPVEVTADRARTVIDTCQDAGVILQVAYRLQTDPVVRWARAVIDSGALGQPVHAQGTMSQDIFTAISPSPTQWRLNPELSGGAAIIDLGIYPINTLRFLTGQDPHAVTAMTESPDDRFQDVDEHAAYTIAFDDGLLAACTASQHADRGDHLHLVCTEGELVLEPAFFGDVTATVRSENGEETVTVEVNEMQAQLEYFASHVLRQATPEPDGMHALIDAATIDAAYRSAAQNRRVTVSY